MNRTSASVKLRISIVVFVVAGVLPILPCKAQVQPVLPSSANAAARWLNAPNKTLEPSFGDGSTVRPLLLRFSTDFSFLCFTFGFLADASESTTGYQLGVFIANCDSVGYLSFEQTAPPLIWSANRGRLVRDNATLGFSPDGDLELHDADGTPVWSSGTSGKPVAGIGIADTGNLVIFDRNNMSIWESFAHPTDTLVHNQTLRQGMRLTASASPSNSTAGQLYLTVLPDGLYAFVNSSPPQSYYSYTLSTAKAQKGSMSVTFLNGSLALSSQPGKIDDSLGVNLPPAVGSVQYMRLESDGHLRLYGSGSITNSWSVVDDVLNIFPDNCGYPTVCGSYGVCTNLQCSCPPGNHFTQVDSRQPNLGCLPVIPLSCPSKANQQMLHLSQVDYFSTDTEFGNFSAVTEDLCKQTCLNNCSCKAALFRYAADDTRGSCYLQTQVFSLRTNQPQVSHYNSSVHIKVQLGPSPPSLGPPPSHGKAARNIGIATAAGLVAALLLVVTVILVLQRHRRNAAEQDYLDQLPGLPTRFSYEELRSATKNFSTKIGQGGFASVYEGRIGEDRVAIKKLDHVSHGKKDFLAEVETIGSIHHINLVQLVGFCTGKSDHLLVYEYMARGSLDKWIFPKSGTAPLSWSTRFSIIMDIARGLCYLHEGCRKKVAHLDIKPQNILINEDFHAKISDFGLSKLIERDRNQVMTRMRGTPGYLAPEWLTSVITEKADIYSFGIVMMEIICGRPNLDDTQVEEKIHLISLLQEKAQSDELIDLVDGRCDDMKLHVEDALEAMRLAMWCLQIDSSRRPKMSTVVSVLEGAIPVETDVDYNFVITSTPLAAKQFVSSYSPSASLLSGPR